LREPVPIFHREVRGVFQYLTTITKTLFFKKYLINFLSKLMWMKNHRVPVGRLCGDSGWIAKADSVICDYVIGDW
jgi:hypothetical protein